MGKKNTPLNSANTGVPCLFIMSEMSRYFVIDNGLTNSVRYRLPKTLEISKDVFISLNNSSKSPQFNIYFTVDEISPWDLFDPFPPSGYYDYTYIEFSLQNNSKFLQLGNDAKEVIRQLRKAEVLLEDQMGEYLSPGRDSNP